MTLLIASAPVVFSSGMLWMTVKGLRSTVGHLHECVHELRVVAAEVRIRVGHLEREHERLVTPVAGVPITSKP